ncbi:lytic transglycosylase domain-containing protein [Immundisolibacter sp.]|uniref:lytic transglycosylase domain-containing protein n=1 Tax=Immundisolibacter sp. TaxID=1934948 RepID=UPI003569ADE8
MRCALFATLCLLLCQAATAEIFMYRTPGGHTVFSDRALSTPGLIAANYAARRGPRKFDPATLIRPTLASRSVHIGPQRQAVELMIDRLAPQYALDPALVKQVVAAESAYRTDARSSKNAQGLMQLIPATADRFGVQNPWDAEQNLRGGMSYLRWLLGQFRGDVRLALAGYNAGEGNVSKHGGVPPFAETRQYVAGIIGRYGKTQHPYTVTAD